MRTLVMETDPHRPIAASYGHKPGLEPVLLQTRLWGLFLGRQEALEDYLGLVVPRPILRAVLASSAYQYFVNAAPALRELTMMGKIFHEIERRPKSKVPWDLVVVDAPASGQALAMLKMPFVALETFGGGVVGKEAGAVAGFFRDGAKCAMVLVTIGEALAISETLEIDHALVDLELATAAVIFNRASTNTFEMSDIARMIALGSHNVGLKRIEELGEIARTDLRRRTQERRALGIIQRQIGAPVATLSEHSDCSGRTLAATLAAELTRLDSEA
jgi:anion-transporting  ArsA/GET3 family ATPase